MTRMQSKAICSRVTYTCRSCTCGRRAVGVGSACAALAEGTTIVGDVAHHGDRAVSIGVAFLARVLDRVAQVCPTFVGLAGFTDFAGVQAAQAVDALFLATVHVVEAFAARSTGRADGHLGTQARARTVVVAHLRVAAIVFHALGQVGAGAGHSQVARLAGFST